MQKFSVCIVDTQDKDISKTIESLKENSDYISEIIYSGKNKNIENINYLNIDSKNEAVHRNACLKEAKSEFILWLSPDIELEDETLEEFNEILEDIEDIDIIYPNEVIIEGEDEENIKNYNDWHKKSDELIQSLTLEEYLPNFGSATRKSTIEKLGGFDERYNDFCYYALIYKNLKNLSLKLSDLSFINHYISESFIDTSYRSRLLRDILEIYNLKEIFKNLNWEKENIAIATAYTMIGDKLFKYFDYFNASNFFRKALVSFHNQESLKKLAETYYQMGLFDEAIKLIETQDMNIELKNELSEKIQNTKKLITELEKSVEEGKAADILIAANDIVSYYKGAPIYNILGVVFFIKGELENSYRFFFKAATMNPLDNDIINNLADVAKRLGKEDEVIGLFDRLTK